MLNAGVFVVRRHVPSQILLPEEFLAANIAMEVPIADMLHHVHFQHDIVEEPHVADVALDLLLS